MTVQGISLAIPATWWRTANGRLHWSERSRRTSALRSSAMIRTSSALTRGNLVRLTRANVTATVHYPRAGRQDPANAAPTVKALIDGCVDAKLLPDDDATHLPVLAFQRGEPTGKPGFYQIDLTFEGEPA